MAIVADEMNGFLENMNRYNTGSDAEAFNTIWSGLPQSINRASVDSRYIHRVAVSIIGTMQTAIMHKFFTRDKAGSGFSSRFLFTAPENLTMPNWSASEIAPALTQQYEKAILRLLDREMEKDADGIPQPTEIGFTPEALQRMLSWHNDEYRPRTQEEMGDTYADACCKLDTYALRFALILEVMRAALEEREPVAVGMDSVEGGDPTGGVFPAGGNQDSQARLRQGYPYLDDRAAAQSLRCTAALVPNRRSLRTVREKGRILEGSGQEIFKQAALLYPHRQR